jgi:hypothetical protein
LTRRYVVTAQGDERLPWPVLAGGGLVFERFTDHARRVVVYAQEESRLLAHDHIGSEHLLLGLLHDGDDPTGQALTAAGVKLEIVRQRVEAPAGRGKKPPSGHIVEQVRSRSRSREQSRAVKHGAGLPSGTAGIAGTAGPLLNSSLLWFGLRLMGAVCLALGSSDVQSFH